jgi:two-component system sensor histidine kinase VicK
VGRLRALARPLTGIQGRMVVVFLLVILLAMQLIGVILLQQLQTYYLQAFSDRLASEAQSIGQTVAPYLAAGSSQAAVARLLAAVGPDPETSLLVVDADGTVVGTSTSQPPDVGASLAGDPQVAACLHGQRVVQRWVDAGTRQRFVGVAEPVLGSRGQVGCVWARGALDSVEQTLASIRTILLRTTAAALLAVLLVALLLARTITGPLAELTHRARELAAGHFDRVIEVRSDDEIGKLAAMFNHLSLRLRATLEEISAEKRKADAILAHMADGIVSAAPDGTVTLINPAAARLLGVGGEAVGRPLAELAPAVAAAIAADAPADGRAVRVDLPARGQVLIARVARLQEPSGEPAGWVIVLADATEQERLNAQRREFVANVSHELRTPLTAIKSYAESLLDGALAEPETGRRFLGVILEETDRMVRLIADLLQLSQLEVRHAAWRRRPFRLEEVCAEALRRVEARVRARGLLVELAADPTAPAALGDPDRILQVLSNLLSNAIDFTPSGGRIRLEVAPCAEGVCCRVADTGVGIPEADQPHIFERFYRVEASRARELGGTGLGLAIAKEIVEAHGGEIRLRSQVGVGTEIAFTLPAAGDAA